MPFHGLDFVFDGVPSEMYDVYISDMNGGTLFTPNGGDVNMITRSVFKRPSPYFYGASQNSVLSFDALIMSPHELDSGQARIIEAWLFGHQNYKVLKIVQSDLLDVYFNAFLTSPQTVRVGKEVRGFSFTVVCDAPWGWEARKTLTKSYGVEVVNNTFSFFNASDNNDYLYPTLTITGNEFGGIFSITNNTDNARVTSLSTINSYEVITMNCDLGILSSSLDISRMEVFNKNWFRLLRGTNSITIAGNVSSVVMAYQFARKVI